MQRSGVTSILSFLAAGALVLGIYLAVLTRLPLDVFWHPDEGAKYMGMQALRWDGGLREALPYPGRKLDPSYRFYGGNNNIYPLPQRDGTIAFRWPILFPLLTRPLFDAFGIAGIYVVPVVCGWLVALLAGIWVYLFLPRAAPLAVLLAGLATPIAFYSLCFFEHTLTTLLGCLGLTALVLRPGRLTSLVALLVLSGAAVALRAEMIAFAVALFLAWIATALACRRWEPATLLRSRVSAWLGIIAVAAVIIGLVLSLSGIMEQRHLEYFSSIPHELDRMWFKRNFLFDSIVRVFLGEPQFDTTLYLRVWQIAALMAIGGLVAAPFADTRAMEAVLLFPSLFVVLQTSMLALLHTMPFLQRQGVLAVAPFMAIALYAVPMAWRRRDARLLALASAGAFYTVFGFLLIYASKVAEHDGSTLLGLDGAVRYLLTLYPLGAALSVLVLADYRRADDAPPLSRTVLTATVIALMLVSVHYEFIGVRELARKREVLVEWRDHIRLQEPVVTDLWWLPAVLAPYAVEHPIYVVKYEDGLAPWLIAASGAGVDDFTFATTRPLGAAAGGPSDRLEKRGEESVLDLNVALFHILKGSP